MEAFWAAISWFYDGKIIYLLMQLWNILWDHREEICKTVVVGAGGAVSLTLGPAVLALIGFGPGGIIAGSLAAQIMSLSASGYVPAFLVAFLQSVGKLNIFVSFSFIGEKTFSWKS
ncbi:hypothetical protein INR49_014231 [Caranx melampygus]|nr:hypothetical protein INR49_014231 [Caranx melampygus]